jgi:hypothetical protein
MRKDGLAAVVQEGCHFDVVSQNAFLPILANALQKEGLSDVEIAASDETSAFLLAQMCDKDE